MRNFSIISILYEWYLMAYIRKLDKFRSLLFPCKNNKVCMERNRSYNVTTFGHNFVILYGGGPILISVIEIPILYFIWD